LIRQLLAITVLAGLLSAGCSPMRTRTAEDPLLVRAYQERLRQLEGVSDWTLSGRLALSDGKEGGSGSLSWEHSVDKTRMSFRGTLGKGAWRLQAGPQGASLEFADGSTSRAASISDLVREELGWDVPVEALSWWIKGLAKPGKWESRSLDGEGRLTELEQMGWEVKFARYSESGEFGLPKKLTARHGEYLVKLVVRDWQFGGEAGAID